MRVLFVSSEYYPLMKTGGLADVSASLPAALHALDIDVRVLMPAYRDAITRALPSGIRMIHAGELNGYSYRLLETRLPDARNPVWMLDCPVLFDRPGTPYQDDNASVDYADNPERFALLSAVAAALALDTPGLGWKPDLLHLNDWQTALTAALLRTAEQHPPILFTIHNLAYQGVYDRGVFERLGLPGVLWSPDALEFYGRFSFIKAGLQFADHITTVSPSYAEEIQTAAFGCGLEGVLQQRRGHLSGIINGIDNRFWNPATDEALAAPYSPAQINRKQLNKNALQAELGLNPEPRQPLFAFIGRLAEQKGIDLLLGLIPTLVENGAQVAIQGTGARHLISQLHDMAERYQGQVGFNDFYNEPAAHRIEAGADIFLMPSRFEPCGLNQLYSMRYGTVPVVHAVGGLRDTVIDANEQSISDGTATGFVFSGDNVGAFTGAAMRAMRAYADPELWRQLQLNGMRRESSWQQSATEYIALYQKLTG